MLLPLVQGLAGQKKHLTGKFAAPTHIAVMEIHFLHTVAAVVISLNVLKAS